MCKQYTFQKEEFWSPFCLITTEVHMGKYQNALGFGCERFKEAGSPTPQVKETIGIFNQSVLKCTQLEFLGCKKIKFVSFVLNNLRNDEGGKPAGGDG